MENAIQAFSISEELLKNERNTVLISTVNITRLTETGGGKNWGVGLCYAVIKKIAVYFYLHFNHSSTKCEKPWWCSNRNKVSIHFDKGPLVKVLNFWLEEANDYYISRDLESLRNLFRECIKEQSEPSLNDNDWLVLAECLTVLNSPMFVSVFGLHQLWAPRAAMTLQVRSGDYFFSYDALL